MRLKALRTCFGREGRLKVREAKGEGVGGSFYLNVGFRTRDRDENRVCEVVVEQRRRLWAFEC